MPSSLSPLLGYNTNVRHKGKVFHVQTEDSGARYAHVVTHLFVDGGRILKSLKSTYAESVGAQDQCDVVRALMKRQHKAMLMAVRDGLFDLLAEAPAEGASAVPAPSPRTQAAGAKLQSLPSELRAPMQPLQSAARILPVTPKWQSSGPSSEKEGLASLPGRHAARTGAAADARSPEGHPTAHASPERLARPSVVAAPNPVPITHGTGFGRGTAGPRPISERRLVPSRPASAFGHAKLHQGKSIFGEDATSDNSLDEVILSYLALDGDPEPKKR